MALIKNALTQVRVQDPVLQRALDAFTGMLRTWNGEVGNPLDRVLTLRDLAEDTDAKRIVGTVKEGTGVGAIISPPVGDRTPPQKLTSLSASGAMASVILSWSGTNQVNYSYTEIWRSSTDSLASAVLLGQSQASVFADAIGNTGQQFYYWVRAISPANVAGPFNATAGTLAGTNLVGNADLSNLIITAEKLATAAVEEAKLGPAAVTSTKIANLAVGNAAIQNGAITNAKIGDLAVDAAKIANATIVTAKIASAQITNALIANLAVDTAQIANAAITNAKIANLAVDTAQMANASITNAKLGNAAVDTLQLAGQAVSIPVSSYTSGQMSLSTGEVTVATVSMACTGNPVNIHFSCTASVDGGEFGSDAFAVVYRDSTVIWLADSILQTGVYYDIMGASVAINLQDTPTAATHSYTVKMYHGGGQGVGGTVRRRALVCMEMKR